MSARRSGQRRQPHFHGKDVNRLTQIWCDTRHETHESAQMRSRDQEGEEAGERRAGGQKDPRDRTQETECDASPLTTSSTRLSTCSLSLFFSLALFVPSSRFEMENRPYAHFSSILPKDRARRDVRAREMTSCTCPTHRQRLPIDLFVLLFFFLSCPAMSLIVGSLYCFKTATMPFYDSFPFLRLTCKEEEGTTVRKRRLPGLWGRDGIWEATNFFFLFSFFVLFFPPSDVASFLLHLRPLTSLFPETFLCSHVFQADTEIPVSEPASVSRPSDVLEQEGPVLALHLRILLQQQQRRNQVRLLVCAYVASCCNL